MVGATRHDREAFGAALRAIRVERGLSQDDVARKLNLHRTYVGSTERGLRNVSLNNILRLARALDVSAEELFARAGL
ncbi:MAG TPA: helix-turn-helix transcriptional regulator [Solirubrobacteraceae bacterium]|jgi:transcriptional regulator with XRE-family HTH domain